MKNTVFSTRVQMAPMTQQSFSFFGMALRRALKISAAHRPSSTRATKLTTKAPKGLTLNSAAPMALLPSTIWIKLVAPKIPPRMAPARGPIVIAPMVTGTVSSEADSGPSCR